MFQVEAFKQRLAEFTQTRDAMLESGLERHLVQKCGIQADVQVAQAGLTDLRSAVSENPLAPEAKVQILRLISPIIESR